MRVRASPQVNLVALTTRIQPQPGELLAARAHQGSTRSRLERSFSISSMRPIGSHARGTAVRWYSDLDTMVVMRKEEAMWGGKMVSSDTILGRVLQNLRERYPSSDVHRDGLAAAIEFGSSKQSLDVVPAVFLRFNAGKPVFLIPDGMGDWFETSPEVHDRYFNQAHERSGKKLAKVSQLLKWWKHARTPSLPIRSFYIDMVLAASGLCMPAKTYASCLRDFFRVISNGKCGALVERKKLNPFIEEDFVAERVERCDEHGDHAGTA